MTEDELTNMEPSSRLVAEQASCRTVLAASADAVSATEAAPSPRATLRVAPRRGRRTHPCPRGADGGTTA